MKTKFIALALAGVFALSASAQEVKTSSNFADQPAKNVAFLPNSGNWFITLQGGVDYAFGWGLFTDTNKTDAKFMDRMNYSAGLGIGKWHNPYFGTRLMLDWNWITNPYESKVDNKYRKFHALNPHFDFLFDVTNYFAPYKADRVFHFVPWIGVGYQAEMMSGKFDFKNINHQVTANAGINLDFQIAPAVTFTIAPSIAAFPENGNIAANAQLRAGLTFNINPGFEAVEPMDYALVNSLQSEINSLRSQNAELSKRPVRCPECPEVAAVATQVKSENVVFFRIGSAKVDRNQMINIFNTAEFVKANNAPVVVVGYADAQTGTSEFNMKLSEKRAREVARILTDEYGVSSDQITIDYKGDGVQPYAENAWNRVVIMTAEK
ncbi:OmpA family protein [Porphyromonas levii]|uniref:OmpA family protein n=1 Tax=Porphyromonas levii TaxID=28114 RepID=UPI001B8AD3CE|nr:OmpA family protein [Porphyromonas levii]MBR8712194.1 Outer membrane protein 41 [Porphyromonas levii]MBR8714340.1 Outer membrane protein 41 [Porphyromonas levii]MBR8726881.1 Outer membrane protein 41 [Porphyromonas levii]MBR8735188.1 Outer membrane protein 41 [Porphyromonas levii]MBR8777289.1 Outer membrane protein 41 [Porphyromonas levii]